MRAKKSADRGKALSCHPRALMLFEYSTLNGGERSILAAAPYLASAGFALNACLFEEGPLQAKLVGVDIDATVLRISRGASLDEKRDILSKVLHDAKPTIVHANSLNMARLSAPVAGKLGIPHLGYLRDIAKVSRRVLGDIAQSSRLIAVSQAVKTWYEGLGLPPELISVVHNGVDLEEFAPGEKFGPVREKLAIQRRPMVAGIGQLGLRKGFEVWLEAAIAIARELPECVFVIAGEQNSGKEETVEHVRLLRQRAEQGILAGQVFWLGRCDDVAQLLREADLLMHAARQEPLGRVLLEALAVGTPIVATNVGGTTEILPPEDHASVLAEKDDAEGLALKALRLLRNPTERAEIRLRYREWAVERFSAKRAGEELARHYGAVCESADGGSGDARSRPLKAI